MATLHTSSASSRALYARGAYFEQEGAPSKMSIQDGEVGYSTRFLAIMARCKNDLQGLIKDWGRWGLNLEAIGCVCVEMEKRGELQAFHESLSEDPQEK